MVAGAKSKGSEGRFLMKEDCWYKEVCRNKECDLCIRYAEMKFLMDNSGIPKKRQYPEKLQPEDRDLDAFYTLADLKDDIEAFVNNGRNLYIMGENTGNGKTSWAIKLMLKYFDCIWAGNGFNVSGYFAHVPSMLTTLKNFKNDNDRNQLQKNLMEANLVIWDDIASAKLSDYDISQLLLFIDHRELQGLANIYTGNITSKDQLTQMLGNRLASRIWNNNTTVVEIKGADRR